LVVPEKEFESGMLDGPVPVTHQLQENASLKNNEDMEMADAEEKN
jgi:hypothetical protein